MTISIKSIKNCNVDINSRHDQNPRGTHSVSLNFESGDKRYHIWLKPLASRTGDQWQLGDTLYGNLIVQPQFGRHKTSKVSPASHAKAVDHALRMAGIGEGDFINSATLNKKIADHMAAIKAAHAVEQAKIEQDRAAVIRVALLNFVSEICSDNPAAQSAMIVFANHADQSDLTALDRLFHTL